MTPQEFYGQFFPYAQAVSQRTGLDPRLVLAQAALETGYGRSAPGMNYFGIKSHGRAGGQTLQTSEFENGRMVSQPASFRGYESPEQSFQDYADFLLTNPRYSGVLSAVGIENQISEMAKSGYATDPQYGAKLASIANKFDPNAAPIIGADALRAIGKGPSANVTRATKQGDSMEPITQPQQRQGLLGGFFGPEGRDARARLAIALEGMTLNPNQALIGQLEQGIESRETARQRNATVDWLRSRGRDDLADALMAGASPQSVMAEAIRAVDVNVQSSAPLPDQSGVVLTMRDGSVQVRTVGGETLTGQAALDYVRNAQERATEYQRSIYGARREGALGADISMGEEAAAAGARGTELGRAQGAAIAAAPVDVATADTTLQLIADLRADPGLEVGTGASSVFNVAPGTPGYDFQNRVNQLLSGGFLTAIDQLRGMGSLSNAEGQTATRAISRMDTATSTQAFLDALADYEAVVRVGRERAAARLQAQTAGAPANGAMPSDEDLLNMYGN